MKPDALPAIEVNGLIILKSGDVTGASSVSLNMRTPTGETKTLSPERGWPIVLNGGEHGVQLTLKFPLGVKNYGLYWFDLYWQGESLTSIPLMLRRPPTTAPIEAQKH